MKRKFGNLNLESPVRFWLLAGASSVVLIVLAILLATRTVHADARLRPSPIPPAAPASSPTPAVLKTLHGIASWYGGVFDGRKTASGERFDKDAMTACHPTLPFGSLVRVINLHNHRSVVVRITDRGDLIEEGRIIDVSYGAAQKLAMLHDGLAPVEVQVLSMGKRASVQ